MLVAWRDHLVRHDSLEAADLAIVRRNIHFPQLLVGQLVQVILRNVLEHVMAAGEPEVTRYTHLPLSYLVFRHRVFDCGKYRLLRFQASGAGYTTRLPEIMTATPDPARRFLICSCDDTMPLDADSISRGCRCDTASATQLCGAELDRFRASRPKMALLRSDALGKQHCSPTSRPRSVDRIRSNL